MTIAPDRLKYVDSIRGIAALSVVVFHALLWFPWALTDGIGRFFDFGKFGVVLFFMVSGFVVPFSLSGTRRTGLRNFGIHRLFRLYPAYWLSLALAGVTYLVLAQPVTARSLAVNVTMLQSFVAVPNVLPVYWTLSIELVFYALCALLFWVGWLGRMRVLSGMSLGCLLLAFPLAALRWWSGQALPVALPLSLSLMFASVLWRHYFRDGNQRAFRHALALLGAFLLFMPLISLLAYNRNYGFEETWYRYSISYFVAVAAFLLMSFRLRLEHPLLVWLGQISYSIYLFHGIVLLLYGNLLLSHRFVALHILAYVGLTLLLSHVVFVLVERPCIRLGRFLTNNRRDKADAVI